jgi:hypothetical protein
MPVPSIRAAVTVAPAIGSFAEFVTIPTMVPAETLTAGVAGPLGALSANAAAGSVIHVAATDIRKPCTQFRVFINFIPLPFFKKQRITESRADLDRGRKLDESLGSGQTERR